MDWDPLTINTFFSFTTMFLLCVTENCTFISWEMNMTIVFCNDILENRQTDATDMLTYLLNN